MRKCTNCLLPDSVPGSDIDASGRCRACRESQRDLRERDEALRQEYEADLRRTLATVRGSGDYDCIVNLSGGKDSCLLLHRIAKEQGLRVLAFTADVNIPDVAWDNIRRTIRLLNVDHVVYTPPKDFYRKLYRFLLRNQEAGGAVRTVCYVCAPLY